MSSRKDLARRIIWFQSLSSVAITLAGKADRGLIPGFPFQWFTPVVVIGVLAAPVLPCVLIVYMARNRVGLWRAMTLGGISLVLSGLTLMAFLPLIQ